MRPVSVWKNLKRLQPGQPSKKMNFIFSTCVVALIAQVLLFYRKRTLCVCGAVYYIMVYGKAYHYGFLRNAMPV